MDRQNNDMAARIHFQEKLNEIRNEVVRMGTDALELVRMAVEATLSNDMQLCESVITADDSVDSLERSIYTKTVVIVMQESPVANDLRMLVATLGVVSEIEKAADDAVKLARRARKLQHAFPSEMRRALMELGEVARVQFSSSLRLYADYSRELANELISGDEVVDRLYTKAREDLLGLLELNRDASEDLVRSIDAFHALEHVADHATEIARRLRLVNDAQ
jgi:phosphate transport system protein